LLSKKIKILKDQSERLMIRVQSSRRRLRRLKCSGQLTAADCALPKLKTLFSHLANINRRPFLKKPLKPVG